MADALAAQQAQQRAAAVRAMEERAAAARVEEMRRVALERTAAARAEKLRRAAQERAAAARAEDLRRAAIAREALHRAMAVAAAQAEELRCAAQERALQLERAAQEDTAAAARAEEVRRATQEREERLRLGLMGIPQDILLRIVQIVEQVDNFFGTALASTCQFFYSRLGGVEGSRQRHTQYIEAWDRERKRADREKRRKQSHSKKIRQAAAVIELEGGKGRKGVGFKSMSRKYRISQPSLRRLHDRFLEQGFFKNPGWEHEVLDSGWLSSDTVSSSGGD